MAFAELSGTQVAVISTEHNLATGQSTDAVLQLVVDMSNMVAGDTVRFRLKDSVIPAGPVVLIELWERNNAQSAAFVTDLPLIGLHAWALTLEQSAGTGRSFAWSIREAI
jgi:hypothetical protein